MSDQPLGNLNTALTHATRLLARDPTKAEAQAREILRVVPGQPQTMLLLAQALRLQNDFEGAREVLVRLTAMQPGMAQAFTALGDVLTAQGDTEAADEAYMRGVKSAVRDPRLLEAATALTENRLAVAEHQLREFLKAHPTDVAAIRMLAETGARLGRYEDAENLLARAVELAPSFHAARHNYATILHRQFKAEEALTQVDHLIKSDPANPGYRALRAAILVRIGEFEQAIAIYEALLKGNPKLPKIWMSYGHALKTVGRQDDCIGAYRRAIALKPELGEAWWSLANLKTAPFSADDIAAMHAALARTDIAAEDRHHLEFALGKALEDRKDYDGSFAHYAAGNALRARSAPHDPELAHAHVERSKALFTPPFFASRAGVGCDARDPIFIVGLPRSGSTLLEQILASHSQVEGTMELPDIPAMARRLGNAHKRSEFGAYLDVLPALAPERYRELGEEYLVRTRVQRKLGRAYFVDKMPNNFQHVGLIHLMLPGARIVDARRHPLGCCLSNFKQHFAHGQTFSYDLGHLGRFWREYAALMAHFDRVLPGRVHRVLHEDMVADPEAVIRKLLDYCGLPFEQACLDFHRTDRAVRTASSEQVRRPIFTEGVEHWRHYEKWLEPLKSSLGPYLDAYPAVPES
jgi:tetratricopeptide (TPR) repeat protein